MSELHYGKNVEWFLQELSAHDAGDIESAEIEVIGENDQGVEGSATIDITLLAADAVSMIAALQQKLDLEIKRTDACTQAERAWEKAMMAAIGEDGPGSIAKAIAELKAQRDALAAENAALKGFFETGINASFEGCDFFGDHMQSRALELGLVREETYCQDQHENMVFNAYDFEDGDPVYFINETPSTDAYLNAVRAEGAIAVRNALVVSDDGSDIYAIATEVIDQLRAGAPKEDSE